MKVKYESSDGTQCIIHFIEISLKHSNKVFQVIVISNVLQLLDLSIYAIKLSLTPSCHSSLWFSLTFFWVIISCKMLSPLFNLDNNLFVCGYKLAYIVLRSDLLELNPSLLWSIH